MGRKLLLEKASVPGIRSYDVYRREGGYAAVEKALKENPPQNTPNYISQGLNLSNRCIPVSGPEIKIWEGWETK